MSNIVTVSAKWESRQKLSRWINRWHDAKNLVVFYRWRCCVWLRLESDSQTHSVRCSKWGWQVCRCGIRWIVRVREGACWKWRCTRSVGIAPLLIGCSTPHRVQRPASGVLRTENTGRGCSVGFVLESHMLRGW